MFKGLKRFLGKAYNKAKVFGKNIINTIQESRRDIKSRYPNAVQNVLNQCGNDIVTNIRVCKELVSKNTESLLQIISGGKWEEAKKKYGYDNFFHTYMLFNVNGKQLMLEKNQVINLSYYPKACNDGMEVSPGGTFTLNEMLAKARSAMGDEKFFTYDPLYNNCQSFIMGILKANGLSTPTIEKFVYQNIKDIVADLPDYVKPLAKGFTDLAGLVDIGLQKSFIPVDGKAEGSDYKTDAS
jgi:hypothetical protein